MRVEFSFPDEFPGQIAIGYATVDGITPVALEAGASCAAGTCYSSRINFYGLNDGVRSVAAYVHGSPWGDLYLQAAPGAGIYMNQPINYNGAVGLTVTKTVKDSDGNNCNLVFSGGLLTSTTCP